MHVARPASHSAFVPAHHPVFHHPIVHHVSHIHHRVVHRAPIHRALPGVRAATGRVHVNLASYHRNIVATHRFHAGAYRAPHGYAYRRWTFGERLPAVYYAQDFWIGSYVDFGLMAPPDGCVWVRFGPDALLIDEDTGEVVQAVYGVFY
jgi:Ni/Co efflux regulator RcnB